MTPTYTYTLVISNPDSSTYWREHSNQEGALEIWVANEKTRPYWNSGFTYTITSNDPGYTTVTYP